MGLHQIMADGGSAAARCSMSRSFARTRREEDGVGGVAPLGIGRGTGAGNRWCDGEGDRLGGQRRFGNGDLESEEVSSCLRGLGCFCL